MNNKNAFQFKSNYGNFQMRKTEKQYADENALISDSPNEVQSIIINIYQIAQKYNSHDQIKGDESFEESLCKMSDSLDEMLSHSLMRLTHEIDFGTASIFKYRTFLEDAQSSLLDTDFNDSRSKKMSFFNNYCTSLFEKENLINESIRSLNLQTKTEDLNSFDNQNIINLLISICKEQHDAIIRCSSRIYTLNEKIELVRKNLRSYSRRFKSKPLDATYSANDSKEISSSTQKLISQYQAFIEERKRNLEKRNLDRSLFTKNTKAKNTGFAFGTGNRFGIAKANYGANNTTYSVGFSVKSNQSKFSKPQDQVLSTPTKSFTTDLTPTRKPELTGGLSGFQAGRYTPSAPKKNGGGSRIIDDPI